MSQFTNQIARLIKLGLKLDERYTISVTWKKNHYNCTILREGVIREFEVETGVPSTNFVAEKFISIIKL